MNFLRGIELRIIVFIFLLIPQCSSEYCSYLRGRTSMNKGSCIALEHCVSKFNNQTGLCPGPRNQCERGWMGPGCQYVNLALNSLNKDKVFDGDVGTGRGISEATINLKGTFIVNAFIIHTTSSYLGSLTITDGNHTTLLNDSFQRVNPTIVLPHPVLTNRIKMMFSYAIYISEIEVFGGKNVALWKSTSQSSTYISYEQVHFTSDKAVDGSGDGNFNVGLTCTHTAASQKEIPIWNVNLGKAYSIIAIKIANRNDNQKRINGFELFGTTENRTKVLIYKDLPPYQIRGEIVLDSTHMPDVPVSAITIEGPNVGEKILTLCEVYVYACIPTSNGTDQCGTFCPEKCQTGTSCKNRCPVCQDGWAGPYCEKPIKCQRPVSWNAPHLSTTKQTYSYNETVRFVCSAGFFMQGNQERNCTKHGPLEPPFPNCTAIKCQRPVYLNIPHLSTNKQTYNFNETIRFGCSNGFYIKRNLERKCTENGPLDPPFPNCTAITCQRPVSWNAPHLSTNKQSYSYNETIRFGCSEGFYIKRNLERKCTKNGPLEPPFPICTAIKCQRPVPWNKPHLSTDKQTYSYNKTIRFLCSEGFYLQINPERKCTKSGPLEPPFPNCTAITCQPPVSSEAPYILTDKETYNYNETIQFSCSEGFFLQANRERNCTKNGPLKPPYPNCKGTDNC